MRRLTPKVTVIVICALALLLSVAFVAAELGRNTNDPPSEQTEGAPTVSNEPFQADPTIQPDINSGTFTITSASVNCSSTTINGVASRSCSGNVGLVPSSEPDRSPGLYKINEQTKLLRNGASEDLNNLQQLSQQRATVSLKLQPGDDYLLAEITY